MKRRNENVDFSVWISLLGIFSLHYSIVFSPRTPLPHTSALQEPLMEFRGTERMGWAQCEWRVRLWVLLFLLWGNHGSCFCSSQILISGLKARRPKAASFPPQLLLSLIHWIPACSVHFPLHSQHIPTLLGFSSESVQTRLLIFLIDTGLADQKCSATNRDAMFL